jgi:hypothetical protein
VTTYVLEGAVGAGLVKSLTARMPAVGGLPARLVLLVALGRASRVARAPRGHRLGRCLEELRSFAEELDRKVDLAGNLRPSVLRRHNRKSVD